MQEEVERSLILFDFIFVGWSFSVFKWRQSTCDILHALARLVFPCSDEKRLAGTYVCPLLFFFSFSKLDGNDLFLTYSQHSWLYTQRESIERERENVGGMKKQPKKNWRRSREIGSGFPLSFFCFCASCDWRRRSSLSTDGKPNFFFSDRRRRFSSVSLVDLSYHSVVF
jgi:hypothetical protein